MNKEDILDVLDSVKEVDDFQRIERLLNQVLSEPGLQFKLEQQQILEVRWKRAINLQMMIDDRLCDENMELSELEMLLNYSDVVTFEVETYRDRSLLADNKQAAHYFLEEFKNTKQMVVDEIAENRLNAVTNPSLKS